MSSKCIEQDFMKIFEVMEGKVRLLPAYEKIINGEKHWSIDAFIPGGQSKCVNCGGVGKLRGHITNCKTCKGTGRTTNSDSVPIRVYTEVQFGTIEDLLGITDITKMVAIPRERIPEIIRKIIKFKNSNLDHLDREETTKITRKVVIGPTGLSTITPQKKHTSAVNKEDLVDLVDSFYRFIVDVQEIPGASIVMDEI